MTTNKTTVTSKTTATPQRKPTKPRAKKITLKSIQKQYEKVSTMSTYILNEDDNTQIKYYEIFDENKIGEVLEEAYANLLYAEQNDLDIFKGELADETFIKYVLLLTLKHFTDLKDAIPDTLPEQAHILNQIIGIGLWDTLFEHVLPADQVAKVLEKLEKMIEMVAQATDIQQRELEKAERLIKNKDVIHPLVKPTVVATDTIVSESDSNG